MVKKKGKKKPDAAAKKGRLLESLVAELYTLPGVSVEKNVRMPVPDSSDRVREIDVLVSGSLAGFPIRLPIECKNYGRIIDAPDIDQFVGKLNDLRLPSQGIYVSANGFSSGAIERAGKSNIKLLQFSGLADGRLVSAVDEAIKSIVYLLATISKISVTNRLPEMKEYEWAHVFFDPDGSIAGTTADLVWADWHNERIPEKLGVYSYDVAIPEGWYQKIDGSICNPIRISITLNIAALVVSVAGSATRHSLSDAATGTPEKLRAKATFPRPSEPLPVLCFSTEEELQAYLSSRKAALVMTLGRVRLPRIRSGPFYWPPSQRVAQTMAALHAAFLHGQLPHPREYRLVDMESTLLDAIWEPIWMGQRYFPDGSLRPVDSTYTWDAGKEKEPEQAACES